MGHKDGSASTGIMKEICNELKVPYIHIGLDLFDRRYTTPDECKDKLRQVLHRHGIGIGERFGEKCRRAPPGVWWCHLMGVCRGRSPLPRDLGVSPKSTLSPKSGARGVDIDIQKTRSNHDRWRL